MRPRLIAVDDRIRLMRDRRRRAASMRPRLIAVDDVGEDLRGAGVVLASMRPRLIAVDDRAATAQSMRSRPCFNEATAYCRG